MFLLYSKSTKYAISALSYISKEQCDRYVKIREIASKCNIPSQYLAKLVESLRYGGLVESLRGPTGGLVLTRSPSEITIGDILDSIEEPAVQQRTCLMGMGHCNPDNICGLHEQWGSIRTEIYGKIENKSLEEVSGLVVKKMDNERK